VNNGEKVAKEQEKGVDLPKITNKPFKKKEVSYTHGYYGNNLPSGQDSGG
jgi:hypothetical protein